MSYVYSRLKEETNWVVPQNAKENTFLLLTFNLDGSRGDFLEHLKTRDNVHDRKWLQILQIDLIVKHIRVNRVSLEN